MADDLNITPVPAPPLLALTSQPPDTGTHIQDVPVKSVNGKTDEVVLTTADIAEASDKLYVTTAEKVAIGASGYGTIETVLPAAPPTNKVSLTVLTNGDVYIQTPNSNQKIFTLDLPL